MIKFNMMQRNYNNNKNSNHADKQSTHTHKQTHTTIEEEQHETARLIANL